MKSLKPLIHFFGPIFIGITLIILISLISPKSASASWFDENWLYRKAASITNSSGSDQTNSIASISIDTTDTTKFQSSCNDIRVTDHTGKLLPFWLESCGTAATLIWVQVPSLPSGGGTVYVYYGNPSAPAAPNKTTSFFTVFDDFNDNSIDTSKWQTMGTGTIEETGGQAHILAGDGGWTLARLTTANTINLDNKIIEYDFTIVNASWNEPGETRYASSDINTAYWSGFFGSDKRYQLYTRQSGDWAQRSYPEYVFAENTTYHVKIIDTGTTVQEIITEGATSRIDTGGISRDADTSSYLHMMDAYTADESNRDNFKIYPYIDSTNSLASEEIGPGPIGYWKFDDGQGSTAQDTSSTGLDGTVSDTTNWRTEDQCISGKCLWFDGTNNDNVSKSDDSKLDFGASSSFTTQAWVRRNGASSAVNYIISKHDVTDDTEDGGYKLYMDASGDFCFGIDDDITWDPDVSACTSAVDFDDDKWHLVTGVRHVTDDKLYLYVDGNQRANTADSTTLTLANSNSLYIGVDRDGTSNEWLGFIDEVKIFPYARSVVQIKQDYLSGKANAGTKQGDSAALGAKPEVFMSDGLVGYWKMDETSGNAIDSSGNGLTLTNNSSMAYSGGKFGNGAQCDGTADYLNTGTTISGVKTVSFWVKPAAAANNYFINLINSSAYITIDSSGVVSATGFTTPSIYVNGVLNGTVSAATWSLVTVSTNTGINANAFAVGLTNDGSNHFCTNTSLLDEVRIYNKALSPQEISDLYNFAPGPVGYWNFEEGAGNTAFDTSGNGKNQTLTSTTYTAGKVGKGLQFNGTSSTMTNASLGTITAYTIEFWARHNGTTGAVEVIMEDGSAFSSPSFESDGADSSSFSFWVNNADSLSTTLPVGEWHHIALVYSDSSNIMGIYKDGVGNLSTTTESDTLSNALYWGARSGSSLWANVTLDDVKVYNYVRSSQQIVADMNTGHPAVGSPVGSPVAHWKLDEGYSTTANDSTPNTNNLTLSSASWNLIGKFGKAWNGTGALWLSRADDSDFDVSDTDDYSVSLWFKSDSANNPGATEYLFNKENATTAGYAIYATTSGTICFGIDDDTSWGPDISSCSPTDIYDGTWHQVIAVRDHNSTDKTLLYIDGVLKDSDTDSTSATLANSLLLYAGDRDGTDNGDEFNGDLDEIKAYRYTLTASDVKTEFNRGSSLILGVAGTNSTYTSGAANQEYCVPGDTTSCAAPVGRWDFEEGIGTAVNDTSGNGRTGTFATTASNHWANGNIGKAGNFVAANSDYVTVANTTALAPGSGNWTISAWVKSTASTGTHQYIYWDSIDNAGNNPSIQFALLSSNNTLYGLIRDASSNQVTVSGAGPALYNQNAWHYVTMTLNSKTLTLYVDGVNIGSDTNNSLESIDTGSALDNLIGAAKSAGGAIATFFNGSIDNVRIYNYARSAAQVAWDYNHGKPLGYWKFNECQGTVANDSSGNGNTGTITIGASGEDTIGTCTTSSTAWGSGATGKFNASLNLDGSDDYISAGTGLNLLSPFTFSAWIKPSSLPAASAQMGIIDKYQNGAPGNTLRSYLFGIYNLSGTTRLRAGILDSNGYFALYNAGSISASSWQHVVAIYNKNGGASNKWTFYINGQKQTINQVEDDTSTSDPQNTAETVYLGSANSTGGRTSLFAGQIDDVRIYNYPLTAAQVRDVMNEGAVRFGPNTGSP